MRSYPPHPFLGPGRRCLVSPPPPPGPPLLTRARVLGGAGFIGVAACKELMRRGVETIAAGRKERPYGTFTSYVAFDRNDEEQLARALAQTEPDVLLDLACFQPREVQAVARQF